MTSRTAGLLVSLYPRSWRNRYGAEFAALLASYPLTAALCVDVALAAVRQQVAAIWHAVTDARNAVRLEWIASVIAIAAGVNLYATADDAPFSGQLISVTWTALEAGSIALLLAILVRATAAGMLLAASSGQSRRGLIRCLLTPATFGLGLMGWIAGVLNVSRNRWGASPWAIGTQRFQGISAPWQWASGIVTMLLILAFAVSVARAGSRMILLVDPRRVMRPSLLFQISLGALSGGSTAWYIAACVTAPTWARHGAGVLGLSAGAAGALSVGLFVLTFKLVRVAHRSPDEHGLRA